MKLHLLAAGYFLMIAGGIMLWCAYDSWRQRAAQRAWNDHVRAAMDLAQASRAGLIVLPGPDLATFARDVINRECATFRHDLDTWGQA